MGRCQLIIPLHCTILSRTPSRRKGEGVLSPSADLGAKETKVGAHKCKLCCEGPPVDLALITSVE